METVSMLAPRIFEITVSLHVAHERGTRPRYRRRFVLNTRATYDIHQAVHIEA